ncbi:response regulator transcription factor [Collimonas sp. H4R21]|uniref:Response regulator transcription factor n=1 Tax=Collimonas rhizosphaerae TaxID=3126357 RepID=A0ABU9PTQ3_9BURK
MKIAVLDDDPSQAGLICEILTACGHVCHAFRNGKEILVQLDKERYDMLILDWQVPDLSGLEVLRWVRNKLSVTLPVLFVTSRSGEDDIVEALDAGADDYMVNPIRPGELTARVQAMLRRAYPAQGISRNMVFGDYAFEMRSGLLTLAGKPIDATQKEFELALFFFNNIDCLLSRAQILEVVWSRDINTPSRTIDTHVSRIRSKLQLRPENGYRLHSVYGGGYRLERVPR